MPSILGKESITVREPTECTRFSANYPVPAENGSPEKEMAKSVAHRS
jgi:hypothetical protein